MTSDLLQSPYAGVVFSFLAVLILMPMARILALKIGFVDEPGGRKQHEEAVPPIGGLVIFSTYIAIASFIGIDLQTHGYLFIALILILMTGAIDDLLHMTAWVKFIVQLIAAFLIVVPGGAQIYQLGNLFGFGDVGLDVLSIPLSIIAVALLINAINLMDGLDGLAGGKSFIIFGWLILACVLAGDVSHVAGLLPLIGGLLAFLFYNMRHPLRKKACVFMGDAGSMSLGLVIAWFSIKLAQEPIRVVEPISVAWIIALPVIDACGQFIRRLLEGRHPFAPDRGHFHHHFVHAGIPAGQSTVMILLLSVVLGGIGYLGILVGVPEIILTVGWLGLFALHIGFSLKPEKYIALCERFKFVPHRSL